MADKFLFKEVKTFSDVELESRGMFVIDCMEKFPQKLVERIFQLPKLLDIVSYCNSTFMGLLLPYFIHNINNKMVGVLGNIDLANMFMPTTDKVSLKIEAARRSTVQTIDYLRKISSSIDLEEYSSFGVNAIEQSIDLLKISSGRSIKIEGLERINFETPSTCLDSKKAFSALKGLMTWIIISLGGSGSACVDIKKKNITMSWAKPDGIGLAHMPGREQGASVLLLVGGLAVSAGFSFVVSKWTEKEGEVTIVTY